MRLVVMVHYHPAEIVPAKDRIYIRYYQTDPVTGKKRRFRETFNLGRLPASMRLEKAKEIVDYINSQLPFGYPFNELLYTNHVTMTAGEGIDHAMDQCRDLRHATIKTYESWANKLKRYLKSANLIDQPVETITRKVALAYAEDRRKAGITARAYNNDIAGAGRLFEILRELEIIKVNPFRDIPRRKVDKKSRRPVPTEDCEVILTYLKQHDVSVFISCLMLYFCMIRPNEQRQLQRRHIDIERSIITVPAEISKNRKEGYVTIPDQFRDILIECGIDNLRPGDYILGSSKRLGHKNPCGKITMGTRYREILRKLHAEGHLSDITGNSIYSWKDTGGDALADAVPDAKRLKDQFRHHSLDETQAYLTSRPRADNVIRKAHRLPGSDHHTAGAGANRHNM